MLALAHSIMQRSHHHATRWLFHATGIALRTTHGGSDRELVHLQRPVPHPFGKIRRTSPGADHRNRGRRYARALSWVWRGSGATGGLVYARERPGSIAGSHRPEIVKPGWERCSPNRTAPPQGRPQAGRHTTSTPPL